MLEKTRQRAQKARGAAEKTNIYGLGGSVVQHLQKTVQRRAVINIDTPIYRHIKQIFQGQGVVRHNQPGLSKGGEHLFGQTEHAKKVASGFARNFA